MLKDGDHVYSCEFCDKVYDKKPSFQAHMRAKHPSSKKKSQEVNGPEKEPNPDHLLRVKSAQRHLTTGMEVLVEAGATIDLLGMEPMNESTTLEENTDTVQMDLDDIAQYAIDATEDVIENVLNYVHSDITVLKNTAQRDLEPFLSSAAWLQDFSHLLGPSLVPTPVTPPTPAPYRPLVAPADPLLPTTPTPPASEPAYMPPTIAPAVPACPGAASFFLLNPEQPIQDLTSSQRSILLPPMGLDTIPELSESLNSTVEEVTFVDLTTMFPEMSNLTPTELKCVVCKRSFNTNEDLISHVNKDQCQNFQTLDNYVCETCEIDVTTREEFVKHIHDEHAEVPEDDYFESNLLKNWANTKLHSVDWSNIPPAVETRRQEAIKNKETKEAAKEPTREQEPVLVEPLVGPLPAPTNHSIVEPLVGLLPTPTPNAHHSSPPTPPLPPTGPPTRTPPPASAPPGLGQWKDSILGSFLQTIVNKIDIQHAMLGHLHAKTDWQVARIGYLEGQICRLTNQPINTTPEIQPLEPVKDTSKPKEKETTATRLYPSLAEFREETEVIEITDVNKEDNTEEVVKNVEKKEKRNKRKNNKMETKIVGDSIVNALNPKQVEDAVGGLVFLPGRSGGPGAQKNRAYGAKYQIRKTGALYPNNNQQYKVPQLLKERMVDNLIMSVSVTDITNLNKVPKENVHYLHEKAQESVETTVEVATNALDDNPDLKVVIMAAPPRFDSMADLTEYGTVILKTKVEQAKVKYGDRLQVGVHNSLYSEGETRDNLYGVAGHTHGYDGVHLRGVGGQEAYTKSVIAILKEAGVHKAQWKVARGRRSSREQVVRKETTSNVVTTNNRYEALNSA